MSIWRWPTAPNLRWNQREPSPPGWSWPAAAPSRVNGSAGVWETLPSCTSFGEGRHRKTSTSTSSGDIPLRVVCGGAENGASRYDNVADQVNVSSAGVPGSEDAPVFQPLGVGSTTGGRSSVDADDVAAEAGADEIDVIAPVWVADPQPDNSIRAPIAIQRVTLTYERDRCLRPEVAPQCFCNGRRWLPTHRVIGTWPSIEERYEAVERSRGA